MILRLLLAGLLVFAVQFDMWAMYEKPEVFERAKSVPEKMSALASMAYIDSSRKIQAREKPFFDTDQIQYVYAARQGDALSMEDVVMLRARQKQSLPFKSMTFGLFDGSQGRDAALYALQHLDSYITRNMQSAQTDLENVCREAFKTVDAEILADKKLSRQATTATWAWLNGSSVIFHWVGDSRAVVIRDGIIVCSTTDHRPDTIDEKNAIKKRGGKVIPRADGKACVNGLSAISRLLGNRYVKPCASSQPESIQCQVQEGDIILLASQGLWNVLSNDAVADLVKDMLEYSTGELDSAYPKKPLLRSEKKDARICEEASDELLAHVGRALRDEAYKGGSTENISLLMIKVQLNYDDFLQ